MELSEAIETIDATIGMLSFFLNEIQHGDLKKDFLQTPVHYDMKSLFSNDSFGECYTYSKGGTEHKAYTVNIRPTCNYLINEWPSPKAKKIRKLMHEAISTCLDGWKGILVDDIVLALEEGNGYDRRFKVTHNPRTIQTVILDTVHEMFYALRLTESAEDDKEENTDENNKTDNNSTITEESASKMDWVRLTEGFNLDKIKEVVKDTGKSNEEKRTVVKAIFDALMSIDKLYNVPYSVDKLILQLYQTYGGKRQDLSPTNYKKKSYFYKPNIPKCLTTPDAEQILKKMCKDRILLEDWQPNGLSGAECGLVAKAICKRLKINDVWKVFGLVWNKKPETLRGYYNTALGQGKSLAFQDKLKNVLG